jgi:hypothetical protein
MAKALIFCLQASNSLLMCSITIFIVLNKFKYTSMRAHQLPNVKKQDLRKQKSKSNFTAFTVGVGGSTAATIEMHECPFCLEKSRQAFPMMVMRALYQKFAAS